MDRFTVTVEGKGIEKQFCVTDTITNTVVARFGKRPKAQGVVDKANAKHREGLTR